MGTRSMWYRFNFKVDGKIVCAGIARTLDGLMSAEVRLTEMKPEWADGSAEIYGHALYKNNACEQDEAEMWLAEQQRAGIPTPLEDVPGGREPRRSFA